MRLSVRSSLLLIALAGQVSGCAALGITAAVEAASVTVLGRDALDVGVSVVTGRDCSVVRLDRQLPYCAPREQPPAAPPFCSKTLGLPECWSDPASFVVLPRQLADSPGLTPEQVRQVGARWPKSLSN